MDDAQSKSFETEEASDGALRIHVPPARSFRESLQRAAVQQGRFAGKIAGYALAAVVVLTFIGTIGPRDGGGAAAPLPERIDLGVEVVMYYELPAIGLLFGLLFVPGVLLDVYRDRPLHPGGLLRVGAERLEFREEDIFGESVAFETPVEDIEYLQHSSVQKPSLESRLAPGRDHEITIVTDDAVQVVARGLDEETSKRLVDELERHIPSLRSDDAHTER